MKKILLFLMLIGAYTIVEAQGGANSCDLQFNNLSISAAPGVPVGIGTANDDGLPTRCRTTFNAEFDITTNSGFKYLSFHSWLTSDYPNPSMCSLASGGVASPWNVDKLGTTIWQAGASILDFGFIGLNTVNLPAGQEINVTANIASGPNYPNNDNPNNQTVALNAASAAYITRSTTNSNVLHFRIVGVVVEILGACGPVAVTTDIWGTNSTGSQLGTSKSKINAQCYICGIGQSLNDPSPSILPRCGSPRQYSFAFTTGQSAPTQYTYKIYMHDPRVANPPSFIPEPDFLILTGTVTLSTNPADAYPTTFSSSDLNPIAPNYLTISQSPYCCISPWSEFDMRLDITSPTFSNTISTPNINVNCAPLPVKLKSFNADRNRSNVNLKWETEVEMNNKGFYLERKLSNGGWQDITFIASKATNGNSATPLVYDFTDFNNSKGITQYRLRQIDIDGKLSYSQIRAVRGEGQKSNTIIYPNPSGDGKVSIVFDGANSPRDVSLMDVSGKTLKQWKGVTNNTIQIDNLNSGFYTVRIVNMETGEQVVEKFIVNKR